MSFFPIVRFLPGPKRLTLSLLLIGLCPSLLLPANPQPVKLPACEPVALRQAFEVTDCGAYFYYTWCKVGDPGTDLGGLVTDGFLDGATAHIYRRTENDQLRLVDIGTIGVFRGSRNGWIVTGHSGKLTQMLGEESPIPPDGQGIIFREDWLDIQPGDLLVIERNTGTTGSRLFEGLGKTGRQVFPWQTDAENAAADIVLHETSALQRAENFPTAGRGCLRLQNGDKKTSAHFFQPPPSSPVAAVELTFQTRAEGDKEKAVGVTWQGEKVAEFVPGEIWSPVTVQLPKPVNDALQGLGFIVPPQMNLFLDDFSSRTKDEVPAGSRVFTAGFPAPTAVELDSLLACAPSTSLTWSDDRQPRFFEPCRETLPDFLRRCAEQEEKVSPIIELSPLHDEQDWANLIAYLAGPWKDETDTRLTNPYGRLRLTKHDRREPWTEAFPALTIILRGTPGNPVEALFARHVIEQVLPGIPHSEKLTFAIAKEDDS